MADGVLLDTSFLITLADPTRPNHEAARRYWRYFLENEIPMYLSAIVVSEFCMKQDIPPEILRACVILPFNWDDAQRAAKLDWKRLQVPGTERTSLKDDIKIIAQAAVVDAAYVISDDSATFYRYCEALKQRGDVGFRAIQLSDGFDSAFFDPNGQRDFTDWVTEEQDRFD